MTSALGTENPLASMKKIIGEAITMILNLVKSDVASNAAQTFHHSLCLTTCGDA